MFYMHLKMDSRVFSAFFVVGLILAASMILSFIALFLAHSRVPFDEAAWRETLVEEAGAGETGGATGTAGATGGATTTTGTGTR
jgi:hypothetical protein